MWIRNNFQFQGYECQGSGLKAHNPTVGNEKKQKEWPNMSSGNINAIQRKYFLPDNSFFLKIQKRSHLILFDFIIF